MKYPEKRVEANKVKITKKTKKASKQPEKQYYKTKTPTELQNKTLAIAKVKNKSKNIHINTSGPKLKWKCRILVEGKNGTSSEFVIVVTPEILPL